MPQIQKNRDKIKMYLSVGFLMLVIIVFWLFNLNRQMTQIKSTKKQATDPKIEMIKANFNQLVSELINVKNQLQQAPTTSMAAIQPAEKISPEQLRQMMEKSAITVNYPEKKPEKDWSRYEDNILGFHFLYPVAFDPLKNLKINIYPPSDPKDNLRKDAEIIWQNRLNHKTFYQPGDPCLYPEDTPPPGAYNINEIECTIYQIETKYIIRYENPDYLNYIITNQSGEIIISAPKDSQLPLEKIISTFEFKI